MGLDNGLDAREGGLAFLAFTIADPLPTLLHPSIFPKRLNFLYKNQ